MITSELTRETIVLSTAQKAKLYWALLKPRLSFLVAFSAAFGYLLGISGEINWLNFLALSLGGFFVSGTSVIINQIIEKDLDKKMNRTQKRPLPAGQITQENATTFGFITGLLGFTLLLVFTNFLTALLSLFSLFLYGFIYTPLKRIGPIAVIVGALPGALPPLLGWVAATGELSFEAFVIFMVQFVWQFPHFWAIAWVADDDYQKAGFRLLPSKRGRDFNSALQITLCTLFLIPVGILPSQLGITGVVSAYLVSLLGLLFLIPTLRLLFNPSRKAALQIMFGSFLYLPLTQIIYLIDKL